MAERLLIGNWKMETSVADALVLASAIKHGAEQVGGVELIICPPMIAIPSVFEHLHPLPNQLHLGAQDAFFEEPGAFTGQVSMSILVPFCHYVLIAHSERKKFGHETVDESRKKILAALKHKLRPIVFIGEFLRPDGETVSDEQYRELEVQLEKLIKNIPQEQATQLVLVYEPVWAVGEHGQAARPEYIQAMAERFRRTMNRYFGQDTSHHMAICYGGSVEAESAGQYIGEEINGLVVGRASLKADHFLAMAREIAQ